MDGHGSDADRGAFIESCHKMGVVFSAVREAPAVPSETAIDAGAACLAAQLKHHGSAIILCVQSGNAGLSSQVISALSSGLTAAETRLAVVDAMDPGLRSALAGLMEDHRYGAILFHIDASVVLDIALQWIVDLAPRLAAHSLLFGAHPMAASRDETIMAAAALARVDVTLGAEFWYCKNGHAAIASYPIQLSGQWRPIKYSSLFEDLTSVADKDVYRHLANAGIPCRFDVNGGSLIDNVPAKSWQDGALRFTRDIYYYPTHDQQVVTDPGFLAFVRNVRIQGVHGHLYSNHDTLYKESVNALDQRNIDLVKPWDPLTKSEIVTVAGTNVPVNFSFFTREISVKHNCVIINMPDIHCYHHWIYYILPKFWYRDQFPELAELPIVMSPLTCSFQSQFLELLGLTDRDRFIFADKSLSYRFDRAYVPTIYERPYHTGANIPWLRSKFTDRAGPVPAGYEAGLYFVTRKNVNSRNILNEAELYGYLEDRGFRSLDWAEFTVKDQIALAKHAKVIVIPNGSGVSNLAFFSPGVKCLLIVGVGNNNGVPQIDLTQGLADWTVFTIAQLGGKAYIVTARYIGAGLPQSVEPMILDMTLFHDTYTAMLAD